VTGRVFFIGSLLAILAAAAILAVLGYVSLRQWEASADLLFSEQTRSMANMAAEKIEMGLQQLDEGIMGRLAEVVGAADFLPARLEAVRAGAPLIQDLYLADLQGRLLFPAGGTPDTPPVVTGALARMRDGGGDRLGHRQVVVGDRVVVAAVVKSATGASLLAAFTRNPEVLRREVLDPALGPLERMAVVSVLDERGQAVYGRAAPTEADRLVTVSFGQALPSWRLALSRASGASPREALRRQIATFTGALCLLLAVIAAGVVATYRLVRRETEIARLKADFVANVSHDLKTPLSLIRMFGETLELGRVRDEAKRQEYYHVITRESERLSRLIDNVLDFSRIEGGRRRYDLAPTPVEPLVREALEAFEYPLGQEGFRVETRVAPDLPEVVMDADAVGQAIANLIDNAMKYSGARKTLRVAAEVRDGRLALSVEDEGIGIPREEQARIFEKFYRAGRSETQGRRGSGVGLALVRHVAEAHGGRVTVESQPGAGSRFTLWLPVAGPRA
jgi:signal transduction histidine kinase